MEPNVAVDPRPFQADLRKFYRFDLETLAPTRRQVVRLWLTHFGLHCVAAYRFERWARALRGRRPLLGTPLLLAGSMLRYLCALFHHVEINAEIGPGFYIGHTGTIVVGRTRIGRNFSITHNVTVGVGHRQGDAGLPVIGDDVWVGTGAVIAGDIRVGSRVVVQSGTVLLRDVPDDCLVAGNPGRVVMRGYDAAPLLGEVTAP